ncbi:hypothetical protein NC652_027628 [Populus alba x Populus x berolinensis]|nr:hypothetical protein NC652_027628 [Populus alba x Populus x berolinensis]
MRKPSFKLFYVVKEEKKIFYPMGQLRRKLTGAAGLSHGLHRDESIRRLKLQQFLRSTTDHALVLSLSLICTQRSHEIPANTDMRAYRLCVNPPSSPIMASQVSSSCHHKCSVKRERKQHLNPKSVAAAARGFD